MRKFGITNNVYFQIMAKFLSLKIKSYLKCLNTTCIYIYYSIYTAEIKFNNYLLYKNMLITLILSEKIILHSYLYILYICIFYLLYYIYFIRFRYKFIFLFFKKLVMSKLLNKGQNIFSKNITRKIFAKTQNYE